MDIAYEVIRPVLKIIIDKIKKELGYLACFRKYVNNMRDKMEELEVKSKDVTTHMESNSVNMKEIPTGVPDWLTKVENVKKVVQNIPSDDIGCSSMKRRHQVGRKASKAIETIEKLITKDSEFKWSDVPIPTGRVNPKPASSATPTPSFASSGGDVFKSRERPFNDALKLLQQDDNKSQVIALCGMGGVGKSTMMEQLKMVANDRQMFDFIVKVTIGRTPNTYSIQNDIAVSLGGQGLSEETETSRGDRLLEMFKERLEKQKKKILVILDDVWKPIDIKYIGLKSPLQEHVKLLVTSRDSKICREIAADSVFQQVEVEVMMKAEAKKFFSQITGVSKEGDYELYKIGCAVVKKCGCLPLAIKLIGTALKSQEKFRWKNTLNRLKNNELDKNVQEIIKISYEHIEDEECKEIFLHCGLFPEDYDIPIEDLMRYAWGLKLLKNVYTLRDARARANTCVQNLIDANLLIKSDHLGCVKMHDLVLTFVLGEVSKGDHAWIINHGDMSKLGSEEMGESSKRLSNKIALTCKGLTEFPRDFKHPNPSLLQLMHGDQSLKFPEDFYDHMENLKVKAYYHMKYPLLPNSPHCPTNLKTLILENCDLTFDFSFIGYLVNLEVLSFAYSAIHKLPSKIGSLKKLKLLDLTGCGNLSLDDGVFSNLKELEELYMGVSNGKQIRFTNANFKDLETLSRQLYALKVEFHEKMNQLKNMSFKKLDKFKISMGCLMEEERENEKDSFKNTLKLSTDNNNDLLDNRIIELFKKTEKLYLRVEDMISLEDIHVYDQRSFCNLKDLEVFVCAKLKYLFPISVARSLRKLERLTVVSCSVLEALVCNDGREINSVDEVITFEKLKFLSLIELPNLVSLFLVDHVVQLPQLIELKVNGLPNFTSIYPDKNHTSVLFSSQVEITKLETLRIVKMKKLEQIFNIEINNDVSMLRVIEVEECNSLVNLFPTNPMRLLNNLERLAIRICDSIEAIFNIDLECAGHEVEQLSSSLRNIIVFNLGNLTEVWRIRGGDNNCKTSIIHGFEAVENIKIKTCRRFRNVCTPTRSKAKFDMRALTNISIEHCGGLIGRDKKEVKLSPREGRDDNFSIVTFPSNLAHSIHCDLNMRKCGGVEVVFEIDGRVEHVTTTNNQQPPPPLSNLQRLNLMNLKRMSHVWKCNNWNKLLILQQQFSFRNLTAIKLSSCERIKYLFSPLMAKFLSNLMEIELSLCDGMEEIVSNRDDDKDTDEEMTTSTYTSTTLFPQLLLLKFEYLKNLKRIDGGSDDKFSQISGGSWSLCQYSKKISIHSCYGLSTAIPFYAVGQLQKLQELEVYDCKSLSEVFETQEMYNNTNNSCGDISRNIDEANDTKMTIPTLVVPKKRNISVPQLSSLKKLVIKGCDLLQYVFTFSALNSLKKLEELTIQECNAMKMIVKEEDGDQTMTSNIVEFPCLKSLKLLSLPNLEGFFFGATEFQWPLLEYVTFGDCPQMMVFTTRHSTAPMLKYIHTSLGKHSLECGLNFHLTTDFPETRLAWSFHNLIELDMENARGVKKIIPSNELLQLQNLETIRLHHCYDVDVVFEVEEMEGTSSKSQNVVEIPNLTEVDLKDIYRLKCIWKSHYHQRTVFLFPNLTKLSIDKCDLHYVFTSSMVGSLSQLQELHISYCGSLEVIVKEDVAMERTNSESTIVFELPNLRLVELKHLDFLMHIWKGSYDQQTILKFPNLTTLSIHGCYNLKKVFTTSIVDSPLHFQDTPISFNNNMEVIAEEEEESQPVVFEIPNLTQVELDDLNRLRYIWNSNHHQKRIVLLFPYLTTLSIHNCTALEHVFTSSMVSSLQKLQELHISYCRCMKVIVKDELEEENKEIECDAKVEEITLPCLKSLKLQKLQFLEGFCLGKDNFSCPLLEYLEVTECPEISVFTKGHLATPALSVIRTSFAMCYVREGVNSLIKTKQEEGFKF